MILEPATAQNQLFNPGTIAAQQLGSQNVTGASPFEVPVTDSSPTFRVPVIPTTGADVTAGGEHGVRVAGVAEDQGEGRLVYEPGHPDADVNGYVRYPDIDTTQELVKLMDARRMYEANAAVFQTAKSMLRAALDI